jgi:hypothetical protein
LTLRFDFLKERIEPRVVKFRAFTSIESSQRRVNLATQILDPAFALPQ